MSDNSVSSVKVDTKLDDTGFIKGSKRLLAALASMVNRIKAASEELQDTFSFKSMQVDFEDTARMAYDFQSEIEDIAETFDALDMAQTFVQLSDILDILKRKIDDFGDRTYMMEDGSEALGKETEEFEELVDWYEKSKEAVEEMDEGQKVLIGDFQDLNYFVGKFEGTLSAGFDVQNVDQAKTIIEELRRQLEEFANKDFSIGGKLMKGSDMEAFAKMKADIEDYERKVEEASHTPAFNQFQEQWSKLPTLTGMIKDSFGRVFDSAVSGAQKAALALLNLKQNPADGLNKALGTMAAGAGNAAKKIWQIGSGTIASALKNVGNAAKEAGKNLLQMAKSAAISPFRKLSGMISNVTHGVNGMGNSLKLNLRNILGFSLAIKGMNFLLDKAKSAIKEGFDSVAQYDPQVAAMVNSFKASLMNLKNAFGAAVLPLANMVIPVLTQIINAIAKAVNYVGMLIAALTGQKTFKAAVMNQNAQAQAATGAADAYGKAAKAAKEEQKTVANFDELHVLNDNQNQGSPNGGGGGGAGSPLAETGIDKDIADLAKMLKEMWDLADFTELGKRLGESLKNLLDSIPWDKIKEVARKLGKSIATFLNGFMEVPGLFYTIGKTIAEAINTFFEFLNAFVHNLHWDSLGYAIRDGILGLLENIDWPLIFDTLDTLGKGLGQAIEAAFDNPEIWTAIFTSISNGFRALLLFIDGLISTPDWGSIARNIGIGLNAGVEAFPWDLLAKTLSDALNTVFDLAYNFLTTFDFYKFGAHIGKAITDSVGGVNWAEGGAAIGAAINALYDTINGFVESIDWKLLGKSVIDFIGGFFAEVDTGKWGEFAGNVLVALFDFLSGALEEVEWEKVPGYIVKKIGAFLSGVDWSGVADSAMELLGVALGAAFTLIVEALVEAGGAIYEAFGNIWDGGVQGLLDAISGIGNWIKDHIFQPFIDGFKKAFGIASPSKEMEPLGVNIIEGMAEGIISWMKGIPSWLAEHVGGPIIGGVKKLFGIGSGDPALKSSGQQTIEGMKNGMTNALSNAATWVKGNVTDKILNPVKDGFGISGSSGSTVFTGYGGQITDGLKSGISGGTRDMQSFIGSNVTNPTLNPMKEGFGINGNGARVLSEYGRYMTSSLKDAIQSGSPGILSTMSSMAQNMLSSFSNINWSGIGQNICQGIYNGLQWGWSWLTNTAWNLAVNIFNAACRALGIHSPSKEFQWIGEMLTEGMAQGIDDTQQAAVESTQALVKAVTKGAQEAAPKISIETGIDGVDGVLTTFADKVTNSFAAMIARMEEIAAGSSFYIPSAAAGTTVPYSARVGGPADSASGMEKLADRIDQASSQQVTRRDLEEVMETMLARYLNIEFYIGEEQVARAANAGNARINRRYSALEG